MERFRLACLAWMVLEALEGFDDQDSVSVATNMNVPLVYREGFGLPLDLMVPNPVTESAFEHWRIQTVRWDAEVESMVPVRYGDDPRDADAEPLVVALYGIEAAGRLEHVRDSKTCADLVSLTSRHRCHARMRA